MEFGPRALGARSILADSRNPQMQSLMNLKIKFRESFRPFAPSVPAELVSHYFEFDRPSPYMLMVAPIRSKYRLAVGPADAHLPGLEKLKVHRSQLPAVTHVDYSARIQTVHQETNPRFHRLLRCFEDRTGCAVLVNTSFNVRGEPIVCTPTEAYRCFMRTQIDYLVLESFLLSKATQPAAHETSSVPRDLEAD
jgi:carbamoyltransferase